MKITTATLLMLMAFVAGQFQTPARNGLVIQADADEALRQVLVVRQAGVNHGVSRMTSTDTLLSVAVGVGIDITGYARTATGKHGLAIGATIQPGGIDTSKSELSHGALFMGGSMRKGDFIGSLPCEANVMVLRNGGRTVQIVDGCGDTWRTTPYGFRNESEAIRANEAEIRELRRRIEALEARLR